MLAHSPSAFWYDRRSETLWTSTVLPPLVFTDFVKTAAETLSKPNRAIGLADDVAPCWAGCGASGFAFAMRMKGEEVEDFIRGQETAEKRRRISGPQPAVKGVESAVSGMHSESTGRLPSERDSNRCLR